MEKLRVFSLGGCFEFKADMELCDFQITTEKNSGFDENNNFYHRDYNCRIKLGKRRYAKTYINPDNCMVRFYNASEEPVVYIMEPAVLTKTATGYSFDALQFLKNHGIEFELCDDDFYYRVKGSSSGYETMICPSGKFYAGYSSSWWDSPSEYSLEAVFFEKQLILDGEAIRKIWLPEYNKTNESKYINADHTMTEKFILGLYDSPMNMTKEEFKQLLLKNDTLGRIIIYTWEKVRDDLISDEERR